MRRTLGMSLVCLTWMASTGCAGGAGGAGASVPVSEAEAIFVSGEGKAFGRPDRVRLNLGVEAKADTVEAALADNNTRMTQLRDTLTKLGVTAEDMKTGQFSISQVREQLVVVQASPSKEGGAVSHHPEEQWVDRFVVNNTLEVCYSNLEKVGELITAGVKAGANNSWGITFEVKDPKPLEKQAREAALLDAHERAKQIAKTTGVELGRVLSVTDGSGAQERGPYGGMSKAASMVSVPIEGGMNEVRMNVGVVYAISR